MKKFWARTIVILIGILIGLVIAEIGIRIYYGSLPKAPAYHRNREGFRDVDHPLAKPAGTTRIAFIGDSYTYGEMVEWDQIFPTRTGNYLRHRYPGKAIEVFNFGVCASNIFDNLERIKTDVLKYDPDIIVFAFVLNDFCTPFDTITFINSYACEENKYEVFAHLEKFSALARFTDWTIFQFFGEQKNLHLTWLNQSFQEKTNDQFPDMVRALNELTGLIAQRQGMVLFFPYFASPQEEHLAYYQHGRQLVNRACNRSGIPFLEIWERLKFKRYSSWWATPLNHHPNAAAHDIIARWVAEVIQKQKMIPADQSTPQKRTY